MNNKFMQPFIFSDGTQSPDNERNYLNALVAERNQRHMLNLALGLSFVPALLGHTYGFLLFPALGLAISRRNTLPSAKIAIGSAVAKSTCLMFQQQQYEKIGSLKELLSTTQTDLVQLSIQKEEAFDKCIDVLSNFAHCKLESMNIPENDIVASLDDRLISIKILDSQSSNCEIRITVSANNTSNPEFDDKAKSLEIICGLREGLINPKPSAKDCREFLSRKNKASKITTPFRTPYLVPRLCGIFFTSWLVATSFLSMRADLDDQLGNYEAALSEVLLAQKIAPCFKGNHEYLIGSIYTHQGKYDQAISHWEKNLPGQDPGDWSSAAKAYFLKGDNDTSKRYLDIALKNERDLACYGHAHYVQGLVDLANKNEDSALKNFDDSLIRQPTLWRARVERAKLLEKIHDDERAAADKAEIESHFANLRFVSELNRITDAICIMLIPTIGLLVAARKLFKLC